MYYLARFFSYAEVATDLIQDKLNMEHWSREESKSMPPSFPQAQLTLKFTWNYVSNDFLQGCNYLSWASEIDVKAELHLTL